MTMRRFTLGLISAAVLAAPAITPALAADGIYIPLFTYRTGAFADSGTPIANGLNDYFQLLNTRDGGIKGLIKLPPSGGLTIACFCWRNRSARAPTRTQMEMSFDRQGKNNDSGRDDPKQEIDVYHHDSKSRSEISDCARR